MVIKTKMCLNQKQRLKKEQRDIGHMHYKQGSGMDEICQRALWTSVSRTFCHKESIKLFGHSRLV